ncbi:MAG: hypothetical protein M0P69_20865 [Bacteroidales bacterium]|jgi:hypothetical protein|nr:hypothetical protein [Bacteroidales bacterium]
MKWIRFKDKLPPAGKLVHLKMQLLTSTVNCIGHHDGKVLSCMNERMETRLYELFWVESMDSWWLDEFPDNREVYKCGPECKSGARLRLVLGKYDQLKFEYDKLSMENKQLNEALSSIRNAIKSWK